MMAPVKHAARILLLLLLLFPGGADGLVLCLCEEGHIKVERGCEPATCCPPAACGGAHTGDACVDEVDACQANTGRDTACTDIPLGAGFPIEHDLCAPSRPVSAPVFKIINAPGGPACPDLASPSTRPIAAYPLAPSGGLQTVRCAVLLI